MEKLEKSIKKRYLLLVFSIIIITSTALFIVQSNINSQVLDSNLIRVAGKQRVLVQRISMLAFNTESAKKQMSGISSLDALKALTKQWDSLQVYQQAINSNKENSETVTVLLEKNKSYLNELVSSSKNVIDQSNLEVFKVELKNIAQVEKSYFENIDVLISEYQKKGEKNLKTLKTTIYSLATGIFLLLIIGFLTIVRPAFKRFLFNLRELKSSNNELETSKAEIKANLSELTKLKIDLELKDANNKIFIEQAPTAIAMLDTNMCYIAASRQWMSDYKMEDEEIVGRCHYDLFPEIGDEWKANHQKCLNGAIDKCDEAPFVRKDGSVQWIYWDVRPWYISEGVVGGLIMHTGDITHIKGREKEKERIENILAKTNEVARIGTWEIDCITNKIFWSKVVHEIHEVPKDYEPILEIVVNFVKEGISRNAIKKAINDSKEQGTSFDLELELITAKGRAIWARAIGQAEFIDGKCIRVFGVFQDINKIKSAEIDLGKAHAELHSVFNSEIIAMVSTDADGIITHFNRGAEILTGYSASEIIGLQRPKFYHLQEELDAFRMDVAEMYGKNPVGLNAALELSKHNAYDTREWTYLRKDGTTIPVQLTLTSIKDEHNNLIGYLGVSTDITEKRIAQDELLIKNQLLNYAEKITKMGNWRWDVRKGKIWMSDGMYEIYEIDDKEGVISFENLADFVHTEDKEKLEQHTKATISNKFFENNFISRIVTAKGITKTLRLLGEVKINDFGEVVEVIGTTQDITEQKMAEAELLRKNSFLSFAERITKMGNWHWNLVTGVLKWSDNMHGIYKSNKAQIDLNYKTFLSFVHPEDQAMVAECIEIAKTEKKFPSNFIHRIITGDDEVKTIHTLGEVILDDQGEIIEMIGATQDVTEQKMEENKFRGLLESAPDAMVITNEEGNIQLINKQAEKLFGYNIEELLGKSVEILIPKRFLGTHEGHRAKFFNKPHVRSIGEGKELYAINKAGKEIPIQISLSPLETEQGVLVSAAIRDITEQKIAKSELLRKNQLLNFAEEITLMGNWQWDTVADKVLWSSSMYNIFQLDMEVETLSFDTYFSFVHPDDKDIVTNYFDKTRDEKSLKSFTHRIIAGDGKIKIIQLLGEVITDNLGNIIEMIGTCQDITAAKAAERELYDAHTQLKAIFNSGPIAIVSIDNDGIINHFNHGAELLLGYSASEMIGLRGPEIYHLEEEMLSFKEEIAKKYNKNLSGFSPYLELAKHNASDTREWTYVRKDGSTFPVELTLTGIKNDLGEKTGFLAVSFDITQRRESKTELLRQNNILNFAEKITLMGNWQADMVSNNVKWSANLYNIFGLEDNKDTTLETYLSFTHSEDKDRVAEHMRNTVEEKKFTDLVHRIQLTDGAIKIVQLRAQVIKDDLGNVTEVIGTCQDVTAQKLAEIELTRKNHLLTAAERITMMGNWQWNVTTDTLKWSTNLYKIHEYDERITALTYDTFFSQVHPDDKEYIKGYVENIFVEKKFPSNFIHRIVTGSGKIKTIHYLGEVILNEQGEVVEMMGACQDITEQKMEENKFRGLLESAPDAMVITDEASKIKMINKQAEKMFGYKIEELLNKSVDLLLPKRFLSGCESKVNSLLGDLVGTESSGEEDLAAMNKEGKEFPVQITLSPLETEDGILVSAAIRDITAQKLAKAELLRKNKLLTFAEKITMMGNWQWNIITNDVKWSTNLFEIFGIDKDTKLEYNTYFNSVHDDEKELVSKHVEQAIKDKEFLDLTHRILLPDGSVKIIKLLAEVALDAKGDVFEMTGTCQDVTTQKMAENKFRGLLESAPDAMVITNEDSLIQIINKQAELLFGYTIDEIYNKPIDLLLPIRSLENHEFQRKSFLNQPKTTELSEGRDMFAINKEGREFPIQMSLSPLKTEEGMLISAVIRDVTEQKSAQNKIIKSKNDLEILAQKLIKNNNQLADFAHITSHNLRAPVSNLNSLLGLYNASIDDKDRAFLFEKFEKVINHLTVTLNTLVDAVKIKNNTVKEFEKIKFNDVLNKTKEILMGQIMKNDAIITSDFSEISKIKYDRIYLESIFLNLVGNSIKYRSRDRVPEIFIKSEIFDGKVRLFFQDNGLGIDLEKHGHKLFGLNKVFHRHPEAKGVGLFMVKTQVEALNGTIYATSKVNEGTTFYINFN